MRAILVYFNYPYKLVYWSCRYKSVATQILHDADWATIPYLGGKPYQYKFITSCKAWGWNMCRNKNCQGMAYHFVLDVLVCNFTLNEFVPDVFHFFLFYGFFL